MLRGKISRGSGIGKDDNDDDDSAMASFAFRHCHRPSLLFFPCRLWLRRTVSDSPSVWSVQWPATVLVPFTFLLVQALVDIPLSNGGSSCDDMLPSSWLGAMRRKPHTFGSCLGGRKLGLVDLHQHDGILTDRVSARDP